MGLEIILILTGLALLDSLSFSAFGVPIVLLLTSREPPVSRMLVYLGTIMAFFFVLGAAIMVGLDTVISQWSGVFETTPFLYAQLAVGVGLFALSFVIDNKGNRDKPLMRDVPAGGGLAAMVALGFSTALLEVATMVPFLAALGILTAATLPAVQWIPLLAWYTIVMVLPPILLLIGSIVARDWLRPYLERMSAWLQKNARGMVGWTLGIVGFLLAMDAVGRLGLIERLVSGSN
jgi:hypothetical protein